MAITATNLTSDLGVNDTRMVVASGTGFPTVGTIENPGYLVRIDNEYMLAVQQPVTLTINKFKCIEHPMLKREVCGADASAEFKRTDFGLNYGTPRFAPEVKLAIEVEGVKAD